MGSKNSFMKSSFNMFNNYNNFMEYVSITSRKNKKYDQIVYCTFRWKSDAKAVEISGTFNNWRRGVKI